MAEVKTCAVTNSELWAKFARAFQRKFGISPNPGNYSEEFCENRLKDGSLTQTKHNRGTQQ